MIGTKRMKIYPINYYCKGDSVKKITKMRVLYMYQKRTVISIFTDLYIITQDCCIDKKKT